MKETKNSVEMTKYRPNIN